MPAAERATNGLYEVSFLPTIDWDPAYLGAIAADAHGDIDPRPAQITNSTQRDCILYWNAPNPDRRSGGTNRTSFMYTFDRLGYRGDCDVYDRQGLGNTNNRVVRQPGRSALATLSSSTMKRAHGAPSPTA